MGESVGGVPHHARGSRWGSLKPRVGESVGESPTALQEPLRTALQALSRPCHEPVTSTVTNLVSQDS